MNWGRFPYYSAECRGHRSLESRLLDFPGKGKLGILSSVEQQKIEGAGNYGRYMSTIKDWVHNISYQCMPTCLMQKFEQNCTCQIAIMFRLSE